MADTNEELVKKDLSIILQANSKLNYQKKEDVKKMYTILSAKKVFRTPLGLKYMKCLRQISSRTDTLRKCVLCAGELDNSSLVCTKCIRKYRALQF